MTLLEKLKQLKNKTSDIDVVETVKNHIIESITLDSISTYYSEGQYRRETNDEDVFYKIIIVPKNKNINDTWLVRNLHNKEENNSYNLIVRKIYDSIPLYAINDYILDIDEELSINREQLGDVLSQSIICKNHLRDSVLTYTKLGVNTFNIDADTYLLETFLSEEFNLAVEFEYRSHLKAEPIKADTAKKKYNIHSFTDSYGYYIRGTIVLGGKELFESKRSHILNTEIIYDVFEQEYRVLDTSNYNDDTELGLLFLDIKALDCMINHGYKIIGNRVFKENVELDNIIMDINYSNNFIILFESSVNNLDLNLINELLIYVINSIKITKNIRECFTDYFYKLHLEGDMNAYNEMPYYIKLANKLIESGFSDVIYSCGINIIFNNENMNKDIHKLLTILDKTNDKSYNIESYTNYDNFMKELYYGIK